MSLADAGVGPPTSTSSCSRTCISTTPAACSRAWKRDAPPALVFPNATYVVGAEAWQRAVSPHARDRASFIPGLTDLLAATGTPRARGRRSRGERSATAIVFHRSSGHTPGLLLTEIAMPAGPSCSPPT